MKLLKWDVTSKEGEDPDSLYLCNDNGYPRLCPFRNETAECGSWCAHFHVHKGGRDVLLTCGSNTAYWAYWVIEKEETNEKENY